MTTLDTKQPHILVVDDDLALRNLLQRYLKENDYSVSAVADGVKMDQCLKQEMPDLIILDLMLPGEDGLALARRLRNHSNVPIIMLSARGEEVDRIVGLEVGADDYLAKPFNPRE
jgi:DNA-binding response OmpR family regulator